VKKRDPVGDQEQDHQKNGRGKKVTEFGISMRKRRAGGSNYYEEGFLEEGEGGRVRV